MKAGKGYFGWVAVVVVAGLSLASLSVAKCEDDPAQVAKDKLIVETVLRLENFDLQGSEKAKSAVVRHLKRNLGTDEFFQLIEKFSIRDLNDDLIQIVLKAPTETSGVNAARLLVKLDDGSRIDKVLAGKDSAQAVACATALGFVGGEAVLKRLEPILLDSEKPTSLRTAATAALGRDTIGQKHLLALAKDNKLPPELQFTAANSLLSSVDDSIRTESKKFLKLPATAGDKPLPPLAELVKLPGDAASGKKLFQTTGTCAKCHIVNGEGKEVGPNLSEIGTKLPKEAILASILDPSAAIAHNYENFAVVLTSGQIVSGLMVSQTPEAVTLKNAEGIVRSYPTADVEEMKKLPISLMPADLQKLLTPQQLVDIADYLTTLKKK